MRLLIIVKATPESERGEFPPNAEKLFADMEAFNNELIAAGALLDGAGLRPSSHGKRVRFEGGKTLVTDGPFTETKELVSGYWIIQCKDMDEALGWAKKIPFEAGEVELRPFAEPEDFEGVATEEAIEKERAWRDGQVAKAPKAGA